MILASALSTIPSTGGAAEKIEFGFNYGRNGLALETSYLHQFVPPFRLSSGYTGSASQNLALQSGGSWGLGFSVTFFPSRNFGVQALVDAFSSPLEGTSSPYQISLTYTAMPPPDYVPRQFTVKYSKNWPDVVGNFRNTVTSINGLVRIGQGRTISFDFSAGLSYFYCKGDVSSLGYSMYWLGGHSVLFGDFYNLKMIFGPKSKIGGNAGGVLAIALGPIISLTIEGRYFFCSEVSPRIQFELIEDGTYMTAIDIPSQNIPTNALLINPSFFRTAVGIRLKI
jgi:hypothetical protein